MSDRKTISTSKPIPIPTATTPPPAGGQGGAAPLLGVKREEEAKNALIKSRQFYRLIERHKEDFEDDGKWWKVVETAMKELDLHTNTAYGSLLARDSLLKNPLPKSLLGYGAKWTPMVCVFRFSSIQDVLDEKALGYEQKGVRKVMQPMKFPNFAFFPVAHATSPVLDGMPEDREHLSLSFMWEHMRSGRYRVRADFADMMRRMGAIDGYTLERHCYNPREESLIAFVVDRPVPHLPRVILYERKHNPLDLRADDFLLSAMYTCCVCEGPKLHFPPGYSFLTTTPPMLPPPIYCAFQIKDVPGICFPVTETIHNDVLHQCKQCKLAFFCNSHFTKENLRAHTSYKKLLSLCDVQTEIKEMLAGGVFPCYVTDAPENAREIVLEMDRSIREPWLPVLRDELGSIAFSSALTGFLVQKITYVCNHLAHKSLGKLAITRYIGMNPFPKDPRALERRNELQAQRELYHAQLNMQKLRAASEHLGPEGLQRIVETRSQASVVQGFNVKNWSKASRAEDLVSKEEVQEITALLSKMGVTSTDQETDEDAKGFERDINDHFLSAFSQTLYESEKKKQQDEAKAKTKPKTNTKTKTKTKPKTAETETGAGAGTGAKPKTKNSKRKL